MSYFPKFLAIFSYYLEEDNNKEEDALISNVCEMKETRNNDCCRINGFGSENVVDLCKCILTSSKVKVLSRVFNFFPLPKEIDKAALIRGLSEFIRRMKFKAYFAQNSEARNLDEITDVETKSTWTSTRVHPGDKD